MFYFFYYFPLGLDVRPRRFPWVTWTITGVCVLAFLMQRYLAAAFFWSNYESFVFIPSSASPSALLLNAYFHGGWIHLVSNLISLLVFGPALEDRMGSRRFLLFYHLANIVANVVQASIVLLVVPAQAGYGVLGASGAIAGVLGLFAVRLYFARLRIGWWAFLPLQAYTRCGTTFLPSAVAIAMWFGTQLAFALLQREGAGAGVACGSHLGGLLAGVAIGFALRLHRDAATERFMHRGKTYLARSAWYAAQGEFLEYVRRQPNDIKGHLNLARTYRITGQEVPADDHYRTAGQLLATAKQLDGVEEVYVEARRGNPLFAFAPPLQMQLARLFERCLKRAAAEQAYLRLAASSPFAPQTPLALYRAARLGGAADDGGREDMQVWWMDNRPLNEGAVPVPVPDPNETPAGAAAPESKPVVAA